MADRTGTDRRSFLIAAGAAALGSVSASRAAPRGAPAGAPLLLDRNENPLGAGPRVRALLAGAGAWAGRYPDVSGDRARRAIASHHGLPAESVVATCGSIEGIELALRELVREGQRIVTPAPLFHLLPALAGLVGAEVVPVPGRADGAPDVGALARAAAAPRVTMVFLITPHNPTGGAVTRREIERLAAALPAGVHLIVDEAYLPYGGSEVESAISLVSRLPAALVLRTLSKAHGLAGLRVGYVAAEPGLAARLARHRLRNGVGTPAEEVVAAALADRAHLQRVTDLNARARDALTRGLSGLGFRPFASSANFVLADVGPAAASLEAGLASRGILVHRPPDRPDALRVTTATLADMQRMLRELERLLRGKAP